ncbi:transporter substrate-binding domain-containing protein [Thalassotalea sp. G2M2-11]|uniref:transporter substrate-binding domain-containing protein n=1 Tax=Thalassotalea sp. G2M2-11 TaxID=2787627 RepID=UPI0019D258CC|nr:transporter substrate-binding domain-containing protein [Thalassotalea sp. G2M2-11]
MQAQEFSQVELTAAEQQWLKDTPDIIVGGSPDWTPFNFTDAQGVNQGIAIDYLRLVSRYTGLNYRVVIDTWQHHLTNIKQKKIDILGSVYKNPEREQYLHFSKPYFEALDYFFVRKDLDVQTFDDLNGKRLALPKGYAHRKIIREHFPEIEIVDVATFGAAIDAVLEHRADLLFDTYGALIYTLEMEGITTIVPFKSTRHLGKNPIHIVTHKDNLILASIIQKGLDAITPEQHRAIYSRWFTTPDNEENLQIQLTSKEQAWLNQHPKINVAGNINLPPIDFINQQGDHQGFAHDFLVLIAKKTGLKLHYNVSNWHLALESTKLGQNQLLPAIYQNEARDKYFIFSKEYLRSLDYFFSRQSLDISQNPQLDGLTVAIVADNAAEELLRAQYPKLQIVMADSLDDVIQMLLDNQVDLIFDSYTAIQYQVDVDGLVNIKAVKPIEGSHSFAFKMATTKDNPELISIINKGIDAITPTQKRTLLEKWSISPQIIAEKEQPIAPLVLTEAQKQWIAAHPVIRVAGDNAWAPIEFKNEQGEHDGAGHDLLTAISQLTGLTFEYSTNVWEKSLAQVERKERDLLIATFKTPARTKHLLFSKPYLNLLNYFFIRNDIKINNIGELNGLRLAIVRDSAMAEEIRQLLPGLRLVFVESPGQAIDFIVENKADAMYDSHAVVNYLLRQKAVTNITPFKTLPNAPTNYLHIAMRDDYQPLREIINQVLLHIEGEQLNNILDKWLINRSLSSDVKVNLTKSERSWLLNHDYFTFASDPNWMPYESIDEQQQHRGMIAEYLSIIAATLNIEFKRIPTKNWQESAELITQNNVNIGAASSNYSAFEQLSFTDSFIESPFVLVMQNQHKYIDDISKELDKRITLIDDYSSTSALIERFPDKKFQLVNSAEQGLQDLTLGKTDIFVCSLAQVNYLIAEHGYTGLRIVGKTDYQLDISFAIQPEFQELVPIFNKVLASISTIEKQQILDKWGNQEPVIKTDYQLIAFTVAIAILIISIIVIWNRKLQTEIELRIKTELELKQSERNLSVVIDNTPVIIYVVDAQTNLLIMANVHAIDELAMQEEQVGMISAERFYQGEVDNVHDKQVKINTLDQQVIEGLLSIIPIKYHGKAALLHLIVNLNDRVSMERALEQAKNSAEAANRAKSEFLANMSHEIRTPMNAIIGFTELLYEQIKDEKLKSFVKTIKSAGNSLLLLINDILDLSKIEAGKLTISKEVCNPHIIFEDISNIFTMNVRKKGLDFLLEVDEKIPQSLLLDSTRIRQILFNLVGNAVKFTDEGSITLRATAINENIIHSTVDLRIDVEDTGIGIPANKVEHIFESFQQQEGQSVRKYGGTGLGLTISRRLTELMNGQLSVTSTQGKGSCFSVYLSSIDVTSIQKNSETQVAEQSTASAVRFHDIKVLVVDDIADNRRLLIEIFNTLNIRSEEASNGEQAVQLSNEQDFDLIVMDIRMPVMDGYQAATMIKQSQPNLPIVALTASVMRDDYERQRRENFAGYLRKPVLKEELITELKKHLPYEEYEVRQPMSEGAKVSLDDELQNILRQEYLETCKKLKQSNNLTEIAQFADELQALANVKQSDSLLMLAKQLKQATDVFDIVEIKNALTQFIQLCE